MPKRYEKCDGCGHMRGVCLIDKRCTCGGRYVDLVDEEEAGTEAIAQQDKDAAMNAIILEAAKQELHWDSQDNRHDHGRWKDEVRERLWNELGVDLLVYL